MTPGGGCDLRILPPPVVVAGVFDAPAIVPLG